MTIKLSFDYSEHAAVAYVDAQRQSCEKDDAIFRVLMVRDDHHAENPFEEWAGYWPMLASYDQHVTEYDKHKGPSILNVLDRFTDGQLIRHQKAICEALGAPASELEQYKRDYRENFFSMAGCIREWAQETLDAISNTSDKWETLEALYSILGIECLNTCSRGYSQSDYAALLIVAIPEAMQAFGWNKAQAKDKAGITKDMKGQAKLYGAWAWGDVYGYVIERLEDGEREETGGSCFGFYGADPDESGLIEQAASALEYELQRLGQYKATIAALASVGV